MKVKTLALVFVLFALVVMAHEMGAMTSNPTFDHMKSLVGNWQAKLPDGKAVTVSYKLVSGGTVLMESIEMPGEEMITMYHPDGKSLMMTHYCTEGNQPRMRSEAAGDASVIPFKFVDATNLANPEAPHMHGLTITIKDKDHFSSEWVYRENGKDQKDVFNYERMK